MAVLVIGGIAFYFTRSVGEGGDISLPETDFSKNSGTRVEALGQMNESQATADYTSLMQLIETARQSGNIDDSEALLCFKKVIYKYAPMLKGWADAHFAQSSWSSSQVDGYKAQAQKVLSRNVLEANSELVTNLNRVVQVVNDYHAAIAACSVGSCTSVSAVNAVISRANSFQDKLLPTDVKNNLAAVPSKAKQALANNIAASCRSLANSWSGMSIESFDSRYNSLAARKNEYYNSFGSNSAISSAWSSVETAREYVYSANWDDGGW